MKKQFYTLLTLTILSTSLTTFAANAHEVDLTLSNQQAVQLFASLPANSEVTQAESYGAALYGVTTYRQQGNLTCAQRAYDLDDTVETKCFVRTEE